MTTLKNLKAKALTYPFLMKCIEFETLVAVLAAELELRFKIILRLCVIIQAES